MYFLRNIIFHFASKGKISYFRKKKTTNPSSQIIQERSYSSAFFWKDYFFKTFGKRKYRFPCSATRNFKTQLHLRELELLETDLGANFLNLEHRSFENVRFSP